MNEEIEKKINNEELSEEEAKEKLKEEIKEELKEELNEKKKKKYNRTNPLNKIFTLLIWIAIIIWIIIIACDYYFAFNKKEPMFCIDKKTYEYSDGTASVCTGLGYKVIKYKRTNMNAIEFGPFWIDVKTK